MNKSSMFRPFCFGILFLGCFGSFAFAAEPEPKPKLRIVTTTGMIADVVGNIVGERGDVQALMGAGIDPHLYKPTRTDIATLTGADIVFYNGLLLEGKMVDALVRVAGLGKKVIAVSDGLDPEYLLEPPEFAGHFDPHVWMDPAAWAKTIEVISKALAELEPSSAAVFQENGKRYGGQLKSLEEYAHRVLTTVPSGSRVLVTAHDAFNYFGRRFNYEVIGIQGISTESEAGVKDIERLVSLLVDRKIKAVFIESTVSERNIRALIEGAKARNHTVEIGGQLFSDAMGKAGTYEGTYIGMMDHNISIVARSLGGQVPVRGMQGKLNTQ